jgi:hypothetical protein
MLEARREEAEISRSRNAGVEAENGDAETKAFCMAASRHLYSTSASRDLVTSRSGSESGTLA